MLEWAQPDKFTCTSIAIYEKLNLFHIRRLSRKYHCINSNTYNYNKYKNYAITTRKTILNVDTSHCILLIRSPSPISPSNQLYNARLRRSNIFVFQSRICTGAAMAKNITSAFRFWMYADIVKTERIEIDGWTRQLMILGDEFEWK